MYSRVFQLTWKLTYDNNIIVLAWELVTPAVYPRLVVNYDFIYFSQQKYIYLIENLKTKLGTFPWLYPPIKIRGKSADGFLSYDRIYVNTNRLLFYIYRTGLETQVTKVTSTVYPQNHAKKIFVCLPSPPLKI